MIAKMLAGAVALALSTPASVASPSVVYYPQAALVSCAEGLGTAFRVEGGKWVSAAHVTGNTACTVEGSPIKAASEGDLDFSTADALPSKVRGFKVNCDGYKPGEWVFAIGYAGGRPWQTMTMLLATYKTDSEGRRVLFGYPSVIPGMSGGPILNAQGEVVGIVNAYVPGLPFSFSRELRDTSLCR